MAKSISNAEAFRRLGECLDALDQAYWYATTIEAKDRIYGITGVLLREYNELARKGLAQNTSAYKEITGSLDASRKKIVKLRDEIDDIVQVISIVQRAVETLEFVLELI